MCREDFHPAFNALFRLFDSANLVEALLMVCVDMKNTLKRYHTSRRILESTKPASSSVGVELCALSSVARLIHIM